MEVALEHFWVMVKDTGSGAMSNHVSSMTIWRPPCYEEAQGSLCRGTTQRRPEITCREKDAQQPEPPSGRNPSEPELELLIRALLEFLIHRNHEQQ